MDCRELFGALISAGEGEQNRSAKMLIAYTETPVDPAPESDAPADDTQGEGGE